ncbi:hypothetical protein NC652_030029 [Populus alba x Populus x berolinensis]|nr:hypothetical protein NC652_030029 [Populus alba x Populus x berolinensis]
MEGRDREREESVDSYDSPLKRRNFCPARVCVDRSHQDLIDTVGSLLSTFSFKASPTGHGLVPFDAQILTSKYKSGVISGRCKALLPCKKQSTRPCQERRGRRWCQESQVLDNVTTLFFLHWMQGDTRQVIEAKGRCTESFEFCRFTTDSRLVQSQESPALTIANMATE